MRFSTFWFLLSLTSAVWVTSRAPGRAETEPTKAACADAVAQARAAMVALPNGSMARKFADADLVQAQAEGGNGEFDDCLEYASRAADEAVHPHHSVVPGVADKPAPK